MDDVCEPTPPASVRLRPLALDDAENVVRWRGRADVAAQLFSYQRPTLDGHRRWFATYAAVGHRREFVIECPEGPVGTVGLSGIDDVSRRAELGILLGEPWARGRGIAAVALHLILREAFGPLRLRRVYLNLFADNAVALRLYQRCGFRVEGTLRQHHRRGDAFVDVVTMGILESEFPAGPSVSP